MTEGTASTNFRYCGEYYDLETGNYYLRARYYDLVNGRFKAEDPIRDTLNRHTDCASNPLAFAYLLWYNLFREREENRACRAARKTTERDR